MLTVQDNRAGSIIYSQVVRPTSDSTAVIEANQHNSEQSLPRRMQVKPSVCSEMRRRVEPPRRESGSHYGDTDTWERVNAWNRRASLIFDTIIQMKNDPGWTAIVCSRWRICTKSISDLPGRDVACSAVQMGAFSSVLGAIHIHTVWKYTLIDTVWRENIPPVS